MRKTISWKGWCIGLYIIDLDYIYWIIWMWWGSNRNNGAEKQFVASRRLTDTAIPPMNRSCDLCSPVDISPSFMKAWSGDITHHKALSGRFAPVPEALSLRTNIWTRCAFSADGKRFLVAYHGLTEADVVCMLPGVLHRMVCCMRVLHRHVLREESLDVGQRSRYRILR